MREQWRMLSNRYNVLRMRERLLVAGGLMVAMILLFDTLALAPLATRKKRLTQSLAETRQNIQTAEVAVKAQAGIADPDSAKRNLRDALRKQLAELDQKMQSLQKGLVPPERMAHVLEDMLARSRGLHLVSLRTLPVRQVEGPVVTAAPEGKAAKPQARDAGRDIYQHGYEITLQGPYADLHDYLTRLEKLPWQMFWSRIDVSTEEYPRLRVTLIVQTVSLSKAWLIV
jgi:MSHA biogenesis protein MshJ